MKPILCAVDYSKNSNSALQFSHALSKALQAPLIVFHVYDINVALVTPLSMTFAKIQKEAAEKHLQKLSHLCENQLGVLPDSTHLKIVAKENALITEALIEAVAKYEPMLLVMGMKGSSALKDTFLGSATKTMIEKCPCPLLAIPANVGSYDLGSVAYATDFEERDIHAIAWILDTLVKPLDLDFRIVHIHTKEEFAGEEQMEWFKEMLQQKISDKALQYDFVPHDNVFQGLMSYLDTTNIDLVAMLEREHQGIIKSLTHIDRVKLMSSKSKIPLLSISKKNALVVE